MAKAKYVILDDADDLELDPGPARIHKVLASNTLHIKTIASLMRLAWGNPEGPLYSFVELDLLFMEFGTKADCNA